MKLKREDKVKAQRTNEFEFCTEGNRTLKGSKQVSEG